MFDLNHAEVLSVTALKILHRFLLFVFCGLNGVFTNTMISILWIIAEIRETRHEIVSMKRNRKFRMMETNELQFNVLLKVHIYTNY